MWAAALTKHKSWDKSSAATCAVNVQELNGKEPFHSIMVQYFDKLQNRMHVLGPSAGVAGTPPVGIELAELLLGPQICLPTLSQRNAAAAWRSGVPRAAGALWRACG